MSTIVKTFYEAEINEDFQKQIAELYSNNQEVVIYLCSGGGFTWVADAVIDMINKNAERTKLVAYGQISSSAFRIFMEAQCSKEILPNTYGMFHLSVRDITLNDKKEPHSPLDKFVHNHLLDTDYSSTLQLAEKWKLTQEEIDKLNNGEDVYFPYQRLLELSAPTFLEDNPNDEKIKVIALKRGIGKTSTLIKYAHIGKGTIICHSEKTAHDVAKLAEKMKLKIPKPISIQEAMKNKGGNKCTYLIDNAELVLQKLLDSNIEVITITQ